MVAKNPTKPSAIKLTPIFSLNMTSKNNPITIPYIVPIILLANKPINSVNITNKFGIIPAIVNQLKKLDCKKYIINAVSIKIICISSFFN